MFRSSSHIPFPSLTPISDHFHFDRLVPACRDACYNPALGVDLEPRCLDSGATSPDDCPTPEPCQYPEVWDGTYCERSWVRNLYRHSSSYQPLGPSFSSSLRCSISEAPSWRNASKSVSATGVTAPVSLPPNVSSSATPPPLLPSVLPVMVESASTPESRRRLSASKEAAVPILPSPTPANAPR